MKEMSDEDIVKLFHSGNGEDKAFRALVAKYGERLYWHIRKIVIDHDDSDDVLQNTFIKRNCSRGCTAWQRTKRLTS